MLAGANFIRTALAHKSGAFATTAPGASSNAARTFAAIATGSSSNTARTCRGSGTTCRSEGQGFAGTGRIWF